MPAPHELLGRSEGVELRHLRGLVALGHELHFGRAAAMLHVAQSTLSRSLADLERIAGVRLVDRGQRTVGLTDAGRALFAGAAGALHQVSEALDASRTAARGPLVLGLLHSLGYEWLGALRRELAARDGQALRVRAITPLEGLRPLAGAVDAAIVPAPIRLPAGVGSAVLAVSRPWIAIAAGHRAAHMPDVHIAELVDEPLIRVASDALWSENLELIWRAQGLRLHLGEPASTMWEVLARVADGEGWSIAAARADYPLSHRVALLPAAGVEHARVAVVWDERGANQRTERLVSALRACAGA